MIGPDEGPGMTTINRYFPGAVIKRNIIVGADLTAYPADNFYPPTLMKVGLVDVANNDYRLKPESAYKGKATDKKDIGCDFDILMKATSGVVSR
jgi:hypothetical protein